MQTSGAGALPDPARSNVETLLDEAAWVRALASRLVGGHADDADDVTQDTWVVALQKAPGDPAHRRSWLARVATNFARLKRRGDAHRSGRERDVSRPDFEPSASDTVERLEAQRVLVDALRALDEPYRTTVMRRYFDGLSAADIARAQNVPAATVRWRLMRGLEELRAKLDARHGDRRTWSLAFLPLVKPHAAVAAGAAVAGGTVLTGVVLMNALSRTAIVAALVLSGSLGVWLVVRPTEPLSPVAQEPVRPAPDLATPERVPDRPEDLVSSTHNDERAALPAAAVAKSTAADAALAAHIDGRFVDAAGRAIAGVRIMEPPGPDKQPVTSDAHGAFDLLIPLSPPRGTMAFEAQCAGWATFFGNCAPRPGETQHMGDIVLEPGGAIAGIILGPYGAPAAKAQVIATDPQLDAEVDTQRRQGPGVSRVPTATSKSDGSFRIEGVPAKLVRAWAHADGMRWAISDPIQVPPVGVRAGVLLNLERLSADDRIEGVVLDPDGKPMPREPVGFSCASAGSSWSSGTTTGDDGRFRILVQRKVPHHLDADDREGRWPAVNLDGVEPGTLDVVLRFKQPRLVDLVIVDEHGAPIGEFGVELRAPERYSRTFWQSEPKAREGGRVAVPVPDASFVIEAWARGHERKHSVAFDPAAVPGRVEIVLASLPGVRGRVLADGKPVRGAKLTLHELADPGTRVEKDSWLSRLNPNDVDTGTSDELGAFDLTVRKAGRYAILCEAPGFARGEIPALEADPNVGIAGLEMKLGRGGAIAGHVLVPAGRDAGGIIVGITRYDLFPRTLRTGSDGAFRFEGLTPGPWRVQRVAAELDPSRGGTSFSMSKDELRYETDCVVEDGKTTPFDLDLRRSFDVVLAGHVSVDSAPAAGWSVILWPDDKLANSGELPGGTVDERGSVRVVMPRPGKVRIQLHPILENATPIEFTQVMDLQPGDNPWIVDVAMGAIEGDVASGPGGDLRYDWLEGGALACTRRFAADANGHFRLPLVPCGRGRITNENIDGKAGQREFVVKRGETTTVATP